jgi:protein-S-isoprenylcysteine O-methyltransferase Ste14
MHNESLLLKFLLSNPFKKGMIEWVVLITSGICGRVFSWTFFSISPYTNILGGILIVAGLLFHLWSEKDHRQAHQKTDRIDFIVTTGVYAKIRHPLYISIIVLNIGIAVSFGVLVTLIIALLTIVHWVATAQKEEQALQIKFPDEYKHYKNSVRWMMIPGIY